VTVSVRIRRAMRTGVVAQMARYAVVVVCGYLLAIALYSGELDAGVPAYLALGIAFVLNGLFNFALLRVWAFPPSGRSFGGDLRRFCAVAAASFVVNYASFAVLYSAIEMRATAAQRLAILIAAPVTFLANRLWSFRARVEPSTVGGSPYVTRVARVAHLPGLRPDCVSRPRSRSSRS
jgi:putative flippase GtrA